jgi:pyruvate/2-oxoglutarate dehydrogenase complex dihydrolipoamide dehydrogenase (E3) component
VSRFQYDLAVIGAGAAGLVASKAAVRLGLKVALIEKERTGGDCTWSGCVPSKALIAAAKVAHMAREGARFGVHVGDIKIDFQTAMHHVHHTIEEIYAEETPDVLREEGIDVYMTLARFTDPHTLELAEGKRITAKRFAICTGSTALVPDAFKNVPHLTNKTLFDLKEQPKHLLILGGGPIGTEMAQAFCRLGSGVTVIDMENRLLPRDDEEASRLVMDTLQKEGVTLKLGSPAVSATGTEREVTITLKNGETVTGDKLLIALGRTPHIESLNPSAAEIALDDKGRLVLSDTLQTTQKHIYAAGDVTGGPYFTHYAGSQAFTIVRNMFFPLSSKGKRSHIPWATYCDPEVGQAGMTEREAREQHGSKVQITRLPMTRSDRAQTEGKTEGFMKLVHLPNGKLLGTTIVGLYSGDLVNEWADIIAKGGKISAASGKMRVYPNHLNTNGVLATEHFKTHTLRGFTGTALRLVVRIFS